jgi:hypothetical protein
LLSLVVEGDDFDSDFVSLDADSVELLDDPESDPVDSLPPVLFLEVSPLGDELPPFA